MLSRCQGGLKKEQRRAGCPRWRCNPWWQESVGDCTSCCCSVWLFPQRFKCRNDEGSQARQLSPLCWRKKKKSYPQSHLYPSKHTEQHECTWAYRNTKTRPQTLFVVSVSHSATCTSSHATLKQSSTTGVTTAIRLLSGKIGWKQWNPSAGSSANCPLCGLFGNILTKQVQRGHSGFVCYQDIYSVSRSCFNETAGVKLPRLWSFSRSGAYREIFRKCWKGYCFIKNVVKWPLHYSEL